MAVLGKAVYPDAWALPDNDTLVRGPAAGAVNLTYTHARSCCLQPMDVGTSVV
jgi:hypothetical protein